MLCLGCGAQMRLVQVVKDTTMLVSGYEHHTWQCSGCSTVERRMTFTSESTPPPMVAVELVQTAPVEPAQTVPAEPNQAVQPVEAIQAATAEPAIQGHQPPRFKQTAQARTLDKVQKRETGTSEAERRAEFNRFWDGLLSVPSSSTSSDALSHITSDDPVPVPAEPVASPTPTAQGPHQASS